MMIKTKYGFVTAEEARICGDLEHWLKNKKKKRRSSERRFYNAEKASKGNEVSKTSKSNGSRLPN